MTILSLADAVGPMARAAQAVALSPAERCVDKRVLVAAKAAADKLRCHAAAARAGDTVDPACLTRAQARLVTRLDRLAARSCPEEARSSFSALLGQKTDDYTADVIGLLALLPALALAFVLVVVAVFVVLTARFRRVLIKPGRYEAKRIKLRATCGSDACRDAVQVLTDAFVEDVAGTVGGTTTTSSTVVTTTSSTTSSAPTTTTTSTTTTSTLALVDFAATPLAGPGPLLVTFTNLSAGTFTTWLWDFGDGATSNAPQPVHQYLLPGLYTVSLSADGGAPVVRLQYIQVF